MFDLDFGYSVAMDRFLAILIGCPLAFVILLYRRPIKEFIGNVGFAEKFFGSGGTNTLVVLIAIVLFVGSLMYGLGTLQSVLVGVFGGIF